MCVPYGSVETSNPRAFMISDYTTSWSQARVNFGKTIDVKFVETKGRRLPSNMNNIALGVGRLGREGVKNFLRCSPYSVSQFGR